MIDNPLIPENVTKEELLAHFNSVQNWFSLKYYEGLEKLGMVELNLIITSKQMPYIDPFSPTDVDLCLLHSKYLNELTKAIQYRDLKINQDNREHIVCELDIFAMMYNLIEENIPYLEHSEDVLERLKELIKTLSNSSHTNAETDLIILSDNIDPHDETGLTLHIDMTYPDEAILGAIQEILEEKRTVSKDKRIKFSKRISELEKLKIINKRIIPCMDLLLWQRLTGKKLTDQEMLDLIFPYGKVGLDSFRKTIKPKAESIKRAI